MRPITVKATVTAQLKERLASEVQDAVRQIDAELEQLESQAKRAMLTGGLSAQQQMEFRQAVELEKRKRLAERQELQQRAKQMNELPLGSEIVQGTVQAVAEVAVGDDWEALFATEILVTDGRVVAIRNG